MKDEPRSPSAQSASASTSGGVILVSRRSPMPCVRALKSEAEPTRRSSPVAAAKESREPKVMRLPGTNILPLVKVNGRVIGVGISLGMLTVPVPSAPTGMVPKPRA